MKLLTLLAVFCVTTVSGAEEQKQASRWYIHIELPARFKVDPLSHTGERKWWAKYDDSDSGLSITSDSYGYINDLDLLLTAPGWNNDNLAKKLETERRTTEEIIAADAKHKTIKDYFLGVILPANSEKKDLPYYVRYIARTDSSVTVYYFDKEDSGDQFGHCYETLSFSFPKGSFAKHDKTISDVIASARPWLSRLKSEQDGGGNAHKLPSHPSTARPKARATP